MAEAKQLAPAPAASVDLPPSRKRTLQDISEDMASFESALKKYKEEFDDHPDTIASKLPALLVEKFVKSGRLTTFRTKLDRHFDRDSVGAGTIPTYCHRWTCIITFDKKPIREFEATKWDTGDNEWNVLNHTFVLLTDLEDEPPEPTEEGVWNRLLEENKEDEAAALACAALMAHDKAGDSVKALFSDVMGQAEYDIRREREAGSDVYQTVKKARKNRDREAGADASDSSLSSDKEN